MDNIIDVNKHMNNLVNIMFIGYYFFVLFKQGRTWPQDVLEQRYLYTIIFVEYDINITCGLH